MQVFIGFDLVIGQGHMSGAVEFMRLEGLHEGFIWYFFLGLEESH